MNHFHCAQRTLEVLLLVPDIFVHLFTFSTYVTFNMVCVSSSLLIDFLRLPFTYLFPLIFILSTETLVFFNLSTNLYSQNTYIYILFKYVCDTLGKGPTYSALLLSLETFNVARCASCFVPQYHLNWLLLALLSSPLLPRLLL